MTSAQTEPGESPTAEAVDHRLWIGLLLGPLAAAINTVVGYTVAHYACEARGKFTLFVVMVVDLLICASGVYIANSTRGLLAAVEDPPIKRDRRIFMLHMAAALCLFCALLTIAGTLAVVILQPCD